MGLFRALFKKKAAIESNTPLKPMPESAPPLPAQSIQRGRVQFSAASLDSDMISCLKNRYISFDVETTGLSPKNDRIIEIGAVLFEGGKAIRQFGTLVNPGVAIPKEATNVNHITNDMISDAPQEAAVYAGFMQFLGDALEAKTVICAHNAIFDIGFLAETLMRWGYSGQICYLDTLSLSRSLVKGLTNYKQNTVASHFEIANDNTHRALADAIACGKTMWELLKLQEQEIERSLRRREASKPTNEEFEVCAFIQDCIGKSIDEVKWLRFSKGAGGYVDISCLYSLARFKFAKKGRYILVKSEAVIGLDLDTELCPVSEGGINIIRVFFSSPFDLEPLAAYFAAQYKSCYKSASEVIGYGGRYKQNAFASIDGGMSLSAGEVASLLQAAANRRSTDTPDRTEPTKPSSRNVLIDRSDIAISPVHNRVPLENIRNLGDESKGFEEGSEYYFQGDELRKAGDIPDAIQLFDQARFNGYSAPALYRAYALAYRKAKDYENEIAILDEAIEREKTDGKDSSGWYEARRNKAIQLLLSKRGL